MTKTSIQCLFAIVILFNHVKNKKKTWWDDSHKKTRGLFMGSPWPLLVQFGQVKCFMTKANMQCFCILIYLYVKNQKNLWPRFWVIFIPILVHLYPIKIEREFFSHIGLCHFSHLMYWNFVQNVRKKLRNGSWEKSYRRRTD